MFECVRGNNGRNIYFGTVSERDNDSFQLTGIEWDRNLEMNIERNVSLKFGDMPDTQKNIRTGDIILVYVLPDRRNPELGTAEAIVRPGSALSIMTVNSKGREVEKTVMLVKVWNKKWNDKKNLLSMSAINVTDEDGHMLGSRSVKKDEKGNDVESYWANIRFFNSDKFQSTVADRADKSINNGDVVAIVTTPQDNEYNGRVTRQYIGQFWEVAARAPKRDENKDYGSGVSSGAGYNNGNQKASGNNSKNNSRNNSGHASNQQADSGYHESHAQETPANDGFMNISDDMLEDLPFA